MNTYLLFKSLHLIAVISWMAGLLYLPRIFVYHSQNNDKPLVSEVFKVMEKGGENFDLIPCLNDSQDHIKLFEKLVSKYL